MRGATRMVWPTVPGGARTSEPPGSRGGPVRRVGDNLGEVDMPEDLDRQHRTG